MDLPLLLKVWRVAVLYVRQEYSKGCKTDVKIYIDCVNGIKYKQEAIRVLSWCLYNTIEESQKMEGEDCYETDK